MKQGFCLLFSVFCFLFSVSLISGCAWNWKSGRERQMETELGQMKGRLSEAESSRKELLAQVSHLQRLTEEKVRAAHQATEEVGRQADELVEAQRRLAQSLKQELGEARAKLAMTERGLVLTFLDEIFFDSGKAQIKPDGIETLQKVATVLKETVPDSPVAVEGHTDNEPIKHSGWRSNWELSSARALAVVHYFIDGQGVPPQRLRAIGFGEHHPVTANETHEGRRQNRRVEVVILPKQLQKEPLSP